MMTEQQAFNFVSKIDFAGEQECWNWTGGRFDNRYGAVRYGGKSYRVHRVAWMIAGGTIDDGLYVLHRCDNPTCVNPNHLFLGTQDDNMKDMAAKGRAKKIHCKRGHEYTPKNTVWRGSFRRCLDCRRIMSLRKTFKEM